MSILSLSRSVRFWAALATGGTILLSAVLGVRRFTGDRSFDRVERDLLAAPRAETFSPDHVTGLPEPARRYLLHAIAPGTPLAPAVRLQMDGSMAPRPGSAHIALTAEETLAPRRGFVWTAHTRMGGLPVRVRDHYFEDDGSVDVMLLGLLPLPAGGGDAEDVMRSARGRLVGEAVWCPTALLGPGVQWEAAGPDRARFTLTVDGEAVSVTLCLGPEGALREATMQRWGDVGVPSARLLPYGFAVEEEGTFGGVTIPTLIRGGWGYGTDRYDPEAAATFAGAPPAQP